MVDPQGLLHQFHFMRSLWSLLFVIALSSNCFAGEVFDRVKRNDVVHCAAPPEQPGFAMPEGKTGYSGFDVDLCRAIAAAMLGDPSKMQFTPLPLAPRISALKDGTIDVVARDIPITLTRSLDPDLQPVGASFHTGLGFMIRTQSNILTIETMNGANFCLRRDPEVARLLTQAMVTRNFKFRLNEFDSFAEAVRAFYTAKCDALVGPILDLAAVRARTDSPGYYRIGLTYLTLDHYGPLVARGDDRWANVVHWTLAALIASEAANVSQYNLREAFKSQEHSVRRLLGTEPGLPNSLGLAPNWVAKVIETVGNYGEIYDRNLGPGTPMALPRGPNDMWFRGGLLTSPSFQ